MVFFKNIKNPLLTENYGGIVENVADETAYESTNQIKLLQKSC
jgi:hypothetical protein